MAAQSGAFGAREMLKLLHQIPPQGVEVSIRICVEVSLEVDHGEAPPSKDQPESVLLFLAGLSFAATAARQIAWVCAICRGLAASVVASMKS